MKGPKLDTLIRCRASRMATPKLDWQGVCICRLPWKPHNLLKLQGFLASCAIRAARPLYVGMDQRCQKHVTLTKIHSKWSWIKSSVQELMYEYISQIQLLGVPKFQSPECWQLTMLTHTHCVGALEPCPARPTCQNSARRQHDVPKWGSRQNSTAAAAGGGAIDVLYCRCYSLAIPIDQLFDSYPAIPHQQAIPHCLTSPRVLIPGDHQVTKPVRSDSIHGS